MEHCSIKKQTFMELHKTWQSCVLTQLATEHHTSTHSKKVTKYLKWHWFYLSVDILEYKRRLFCENQWWQSQEEVWIPTIAPSVIWQTLPAAERKS